jgi:hypothetical protein
MTMLDIGEIRKLSYGCVLKNDRWTYTIYSLINLDNMKRYIGRTRNFRGRLENHFFAIKTHKHGNKYINADSNCRFAYEILEEGVSYADRKKERAYILLHRTYDETMGYNKKDPTLFTLKGLVPQGEGWKGSKRTRGEK